MAERIVMVYVVGALIVLLAFIVLAIVSQVSGLELALACVEAGSSWSDGSCSA